MSGLVASGDVFFDLLDDNGNSTGLFGPYNVTELRLTPGEAERLTRPSFMNDNYGAALDSVVKPQPAEVVFTTDEVIPKTVAMQLLGDITTSSQAAGSATDESVTAKLGAWIELTKRNLSNVVVTSDPAGTTYVEGTDYEVKYAGGMIKVIEGGAISDSDPLLVSYDYAAVDTTQIDGAKNTSVPMRIRMNGINLADGRKIEVEVPKAVMSPSGEFNPLGGEFQAIQMTGEATVVNSQAPYTWYYRDAAA